MDYDQDPKLLALVDAAAEAIASVSHRNDGQRVGIQVYITLRAADMCCKRMLAFCQFHARCKTAPLLLTCISNSNMHWHSCTIPDLSVAHKLPLALHLCALPLHVHTHTLRISSCRYFPCFALMSMVTVSCSLQCCKPLNQNQANRITCRPWLA